MKSKCPHLILLFQQASRLVLISAQQQQHPVSLTCASAVERGSMWMQEKPPSEHTCIAGSGSRPCWYTRPLDLEQDPDPAWIRAFPVSEPAAGRPPSSIPAFHKPSSIINHPHVRRLE
ncbi:hypothetical protein D4764_04G0003300 [Takifugu flavidus]|uniref:Secreted protein n=1 Tax=Takifugu flavidus TaxID=433684 RepID=A0A5C6N3B1_9TELE|nr:hypothetical protein D4764_04G0003300 [Takifugu flavidus]